MTAKMSKRAMAAFSLLAKASNRMHGSFDIAEIVHTGIAAALELVEADSGAVGLMLDGRLAFSEHVQPTGSQPLACRFDAGLTWVADLQHDQLAFVIRDADELQQFGTETEHCFPGSEQVAVIPVAGAHHDLLACLLLFVTDARAFTEDDLELLEHLASVMSVAIENAIQQSEKSRIEADLEKSVATYRTLVEQIPAITYIATLDRSRILFVSPQVEDILGYHQDEFLANQEIWSQQIHPDDRERVLSEVKLSLSEQAPFHSEYRIRGKDGRDIWVKDAAATVREHDQDLYLQGVVYDISERKASEHKLMVMAHFDQLTGLANRALFQDRLTQVVAMSRRHGKKFAVLYIDLDGFKAVNDQLGHQAGDELLIEVSHRMKASVREVDTVARMGGDEFTILLDDVHERDTIERIADKLVTVIAEPYAHLNEGQHVTMSMGIAVYPDDGMQGEMLLTAADNAMYRAKGSGKNRYCFHSGG